VDFSADVACLRCLFGTSGAFCRGSFSSCRLCPCRTLRVGPLFANEVYRFRNSRRRTL
jgi:hypothetical protein